ncbi:MAG: ATP-binding protein [Spirochaetales bacterium]|uniref:histidine kinase n=1 Tax=Candidatus Thalassospirochaeta sargassi TaxID=3119039 RepID=A0AAJ1MNY1_9SPIO|nr:ATP-binding protein [Spirochaetales bacterium]
MKLSIRALLFFIGVVVFQSALTFILVTGIITRNNELDVRMVLGQESGAVYDEYNSWLRTLWKTTIRIDKDSHYRRLLEDPRIFFTEEGFDAWFDEIQLLSDVDSIILKYRAGNDFEFIVSGTMFFSHREMEELNSYKDHPYLELREIGGDVYLIGNLRRNDHLEVFVFKKIDEHILAGSFLPARSLVLFVSECSLNSKSMLSLSLYDELQKTGLPDIPYSEVYDVKLDGQSYNVSFQSLGHLRMKDGVDNFYLILLISNEPFLSILGSIYNTLVSVSFVVSFLAILLSLYFSKNITNPISRLMHAMVGIREGNLKVKVDYESDNEVGKLFQGFNDMARQLDQNKTSMERYINEITFLKDYNEKIIYSLRAGILVVDSDLSIEKVNNFFLDLCQCDESRIINQKIDNLNIEMIDNAVIRKTGDVISGVIDSWSKIKRSDDFVYEIKLYLLFTNARKGERKCVLEIDDVSRKYELEEKIFQAEKLSALSVLSAGVSHEINNPLSSILTNVQILLDEDNDKETRTALSWIEQETRRIAKIVTDLLNFSADQQGESGGCEVDAVIEDVLKLINYGLAKEHRISLSSVFQEALPRVVVSRNELKQVIINLVQNSIYAIEDYGEIKVRAKCKNNMVHVQVIDNGIGMNEETMQHVFDPFFTTRTNGKGTGLGLSIVYGIINKYSGSIDVKSVVGTGTTVSLMLPILCEGGNPRRGM